MTTAELPPRAAGRTLGPEELDEIAAEAETRVFDHDEITAMRGAARPIRRQHMISRMLLNRWTTPGARSPKLLEVDAIDGSYRHTSPKSAATYSAYADPSLVVEIEGMWSRLESTAGAALQTLLAGEDPSIGQEEAIRDLMAVHYARSMLVLELAESFRDNSPTLRYWRDPPSEMLDGIFKDLTGLHGAGAGARHLAQTCVDAMIEETFTTRFTRALPTLLEQARCWYRDATLAWAHIEGDFPLVIADKPIVAFKINEQQQPTQCEVALLGQADGAAMPLSPNCLVFAFRSEAAVPASIRDNTARINQQTLNLMQNRQARRYLYCHPQSDFARWVKANCKPATNRTGDLK